MFLTKINLRALLPHWHIYLLQSDSFKLRYNWHTTLCCSGLIFTYIAKLVTISLVNTHYHTYLHIFFIVMRTLKIYSLSNFQVCNMVLSIITVLYIISRWFIYFVIANLYLWPPLPILTTPSPNPLPLQLPIFSLYFWA